MKSGKPRLAVAVGLIAAIMGVAHCNVHAAQEWELVQKAMTQDGPKSAESLLIKAVDVGPINADLAYNMGTVYLMQNKVGEAVWHLETAKILRPRDVDIRHNLAAAHQRVRIESMTPVWDAILEWVRWISVGEAAWIGVGVGFIFSITLLLVILGRCRPYWLKGVGIVGLIVVIPVGVRIWDAQTPRAVVVSEQFKLKVSPEPDAITISDIPAGTVGRITEFSVGWLQIQLPDGAIGWGSRNDIRLL